LWRLRIVRREGWHGSAGLSFVVHLLHALVSVQLPQLVHEVRGYEIRRVFRYNADDEDSVVAEIVVGELLAELLVEAGVQLVVDLQVLLDVARAVTLEDHPVQPAGHVDAGQHRDQDQPEPDDHEDLLVEEVDWQHALHRERLDVLQLSDLEVAERDAGEARRLLPVRVARAQHVKDLRAVETEVLREEGVEQEELSYDVGRVGDLDEQVEGREVRPRPLVAEEAAEARQLLLGPDQHVPVVLPVHVVDGFLSVVWRAQLSALSHVYDLVQVDPRASVEQTPQDVGELEHKRLRE
ncbi:hypothetical protein EGW08_009417, partial [Elysia chlorotica]